MNQIKNKGGRPSIKYPYLWDMYHIQWENGDITEKEMMNWLGLKRTTLYKLSKQYKNSLYDEVRKNNRKEKDKKDKKDKDKENVIEYIKENTKYSNKLKKDIFCIKHETMMSKCELSSPTILKIIKDLEKERDLIKIKRGNWEINFK